MQRTELKNLMRKHCLVSSELDSVFGFVEDLLRHRRKELEKNEPYATRNIKSIESAENEVHDLIDYIGELEN